MDGYHINYHCTRKIWIFVLSLVIILDCYFHVYVYYNFLHSPDMKKLYDRNQITDNTYDQNETINYYKYPLIDSSEAIMDYINKYNSSYYWFISMKHLFKDTGEETAPKYPKDTPVCQLNTTLEPIRVNKNETQQEWTEKQNLIVKLGGYYAPAHCRAKNRVAIIIPYRNCTVNLDILLSHLHPLLQKKLLEYRIFVIEQYGREKKFNKGALYNIAFLETQRFGTWDCLILHDVDLIPEDERIPYSCPEFPTHISPAVKSWGYSNMSGGVTALTPEQYESVNGYSNYYWNWGVEDDVFFGRVQSKNFTVTRYNSSLSRYATLSKPKNDVGRERTLLHAMSKQRFQKEGLSTIKYKIIDIKEEKLYTHVLADVNPNKAKLKSKSLMQRLINLNGKTIIYGRLDYKL